MKKLSIVLLTVTGILVIALGAIVLANAFKVTDPADPRFHPDKFEFSDYRNQDDLRAAFIKLFPVGVDKSYVDKILVNSAHAQIEAIKMGASPHQFWHIRYTEPYNPFRQFKEAAFHIFIFDMNEKLENIHPFSGSKLYETNNGRDEFYKLNKR